MPLVCAPETRKNVQKKQQTSADKWRDLLVLWSGARRLGGQ